MFQFKIKTLSLHNENLTLNTGLDFLLHAQPDLKKQKVGS